MTKSTGKKQANMVRTDLTEDERKANFVEAVRKVGSWPRAAKLAEPWRMDRDGNVSTSIFFRWRKEDPAFAQAIEEARAEFAHSLEDEAIRRAYNGYSEPIFNAKGEKIGERMHFSDTLMRDLLRAFLPERYSPKMQVQAQLDAHLRADIRSRHESVNVVLDLDSLNDEQRQLFVEMMRTQLPVEQRDAVTDEQILALAKKELSNAGH